MDDIAACIKDHQYNEAIRKTVVDPEEALARAILDKIPMPGKAEIAAVILPNEDFARTADLQHIRKRSLGRFFICESLTESDEQRWPSANLLMLQRAYDFMDEYLRSEQPSRTEAETLAGKLVRLSKTLRSPELETAADAAAAAVKAASFQTDEPDALRALFAEVDAQLEALVFAPGFKLFLAHETFPAKFQQCAWYSARDVCMDDFVVFRDLGRGAFGVVSGARHRVTGQMVALKGMNRKLVKGKRVLSMVKGEFKILKALGDKPSPFCVSLVYSFMDSTDLFLGLPLCTGGDLMFHLRSMPQGYGVASARFFAAEILLAIEHLHNLGILYRDLKPENVLLTDKGHTKISDMGLAVLTGRTPRTMGEKLLQGRAGTPGYWPPEMLLKKGYGFDADWWSYGVMLFELLTGVCCFTETHSGCKDRNEATLQWPLAFPDQAGSDPFPEPAKDLIARLLDRDRTARLGAKPDAVEQIKAHAYFEGIDWTALTSHKMVPPWTPPADSINAASQEELQGRSKEHEFKKLKLAPEDDIEGITYSSRNHERDLVIVLQLERKGKLEHLNASTSSTCAIL